MFSTTIDNILCFWVLINWKWVIILLVFCNLWNLGLFDFRRPPPHPPYLDRFPNFPRFLIWKASFTVFTAWNMTKCNILFDFQPWKCLQIFGSSAPAMRFSTSSWSKRTKISVLSRVIFISQSHLYLILDRNVFFILAWSCLSLRQRYFHPKAVFDINKYVLCPISFWR